MTCLYQRFYGAFLLFFYERLNSLLRVVNSLFTDTFIFDRGLASAQNQLAQNDLVQNQLTAAQNNLEQNQLAQNQLTSAQNNLEQNQIDFNQNQMGSAQNCVDDEGEEDDDEPMTEKEKNDTAYLAFKKQIESLMKQKIGKKFIDLSFDEMRTRTIAKRNA